MIRPTLINLHPNEYSQESHYYPFVVKLERCIGSYNTLHDLSNKVCVPNKTEDLNLGVLNVITGINELKHVKKTIFRILLLAIKKMKNIQQILWMIQRLSVMKL